MSDNQFMRATFATERASARSGGIGGLRRPDVQHGHAAPISTVYVLGIDRALDAEARVERLVVENETRLVRYVRRLVNDGETTLDIVQDSFFAAYRTLRRDPSRPLTAGWLYRTATNFAITHLRKKQRRGEAVPLDDAMGAFRPDEGLALQLDLQRALHALGHEQLAAVLLTTYAGYSSSETALILGTSPDAVRQRVFRAMRALRKSLAEPT